MSLYNFFRHVHKKPMLQRWKQENKETLDQKQERKYFIPLSFLINRRLKIKQIKKKQADQKRARSQHSIRRIDNWMTNSLTQDPNLKRILNEGFFPMKHTAHYQWRKDRDRQKQLGPDFYLRNNLLHKERCQQTYEEHESRHLMREGYLDKQPYKSPDWMRPDDPASEIHPPRRYGVRTENERVIKKIKEIGSAVDHSSKNCEMLYSPHWKNGYKTKKQWQNKRGFDLTTNKFGTKITERCCWPQTPLIIEGMNEPYIDGHAVMGDISRKRQKHKEIHPTGFQGVVGSNLWQKNMHISQSVRTGHYDNAFNLSPKYADPQAKYLERNYKRALIKSASMKNQIPFVHSQKNSLIDLRPMTQGRMYPKTLKSYITNPNRMVNTALGSSRDFKTTTQTEFMMFQQSTQQIIEEEEKPVKTVTNDSTRIQTAMPNTRQIQKIPSMENIDIDGRSSQRNMKRSSLASSEFSQRKKSGSSRLQMRSQLRKGRLHEKLKNGKRFKLKRKKQTEEEKNAMIHKTLNDYFEDKDKRKSMRKSRRLTESNY